MTIRTIAVTLPAPRDAVFNYLADVENLPRWAPGYCERIGLERGRWWALTSERIGLERGRWWALTIEGEQVVELDANPGAGVIDLRAGPRPDRMQVTPVRVLALSRRRTLVTFTVIEAPDQSDAACERRCELMAAAADGLRQRFGGGELHAPEAPPQLAELGVN